MKQDGRAGAIGVVGLNLGGPDSPDAVEPFLRRLFSDPEVIQLGWARPLQPLLARLIAKRRAPFSRAAYQEIGGRSPIREETMQQIAAVADNLRARGIDARPYVAMACWHPLSEEAVAAMQADGVTRAVALPLYPHESRTTTGSSLALLSHALAKAKSNIALGVVRHYPDAPGYVAALCDRAREAIATLPEAARDVAPVLFSAHGLPESYIRKGDPYLDEIRTTVAAVSRQLDLGGRAQLCFQSRVGRQKWLGPYTEDALDALAAAGQRAVVVVPVAFTGEHIETLQEIDILYRRRAHQRGIAHFARARTVGLHPAFIGALADLTAAVARAQGWA
ncbi:MAG TPA: ferrochelatase [Polyangia bacterium]|nr:ferrochelatase [Polyangia bacterium]